jgi:nicotinate-nucleotide adenylyltransferase
MKPRRRIALFGGTFDPVHAGHLRIAELAREQAQLDEVVFLPCQQSPHKESRCIATAEQRLSMLKLATTEPWMKVDDFELQQPPPSFSVDTLRHFLKAQPNVDWHWIMGSDQWLALPRWKEPEVLAQHLTFLVLPRGQAPEIRIGYHMQVLVGEHPASSTELRDEANPHFLDPAWLPPRVRDYILTQKLYLPFSSSPLARANRTE